MPDLDVRPTQRTRNLSAQVRIAIYVVTAVASIGIAYGSARGWGWMGDGELVAWSILVALVTGLAAVNVRNGAR